MEFYVACAELVNRGDAVTVFASAIRLKASNSDQVVQQLESAERTYSEQFDRLYNLQVARQLEAEKNLADFVITY